MIFRMIITRHGVWHVLIAGAICAAAIAGLWKLAACAGCAWGILMILPLVLFGWVVWFFRDPNRVPTDPADRSIISSADGKVTDVTPLGPESELGCEGLRIGVFMSVFSVHVNRMPLSGTITKVLHRPGVFMDVRDPVAAERNESVSVSLDHERNGKTFPVVVRQIAGLVARRIVTTVAPGDTLERNDKIGMIRFGSRVEISLPSELVDEVCVEIGQMVKAGHTVLAYAKESV